MTPPSGLRFGMAFFGIGCDCVRPWACVGHRIARSLYAANSIRAAIISQPRAFHQWKLYSDWASPGLGQRRVDRALRQLPLEFLQACTSDVCVANGQFPQRFQFLQMFQSGVADGCAIEVQEFELI